MCVFGSVYRGFVSESEENASFWQRAQFFARQGKSRGQRLSPEIEK